MYSSLGVSVRPPPMARHLHRPCLCRAEKADRPPFVDFYDVLQVDSDATIGEIKYNYRKLQKHHHPDISGENERSSNLNEAYQTLVDPNLRTQYDRRLSSVPLSQRPLKRGFNSQPGIVGPLSDAELVLKDLIPTDTSPTNVSIKEKNIVWLREWAKTFIFASDYPVALPLQCDDVEDGVRLAFITTAKNRIRSAGELLFLVETEQDEDHDKMAAPPLPQHSISVYRRVLSQAIRPGEVQVMKAFRNALRDKHASSTKARNFHGIELTGIAAIIAAEFMPVFTSLPIGKFHGSSYAAYHLKRPNSTLMP